MTKKRHQHTDILSLTLPLNKPLLSAAIEMRSACRATRQQSVAQELFARWPHLRESSQKLTSLLTIHWPDPRNHKESLLVNCLAKGLTEAESVINKEKNDVAEQIAFISCISSELVQCLETTVMIKTKDVWSPFDPISDGYLDEITSLPTTEAITWGTKKHKASGSPQSSLICALKVFSTNDLMMAGLMESPLSTDR